MAKWGIAYTGIYKYAGAGLSIWNIFELFYVISRIWR